MKLHFKENIFAYLGDTQLFSIRKQSNINSIELFSNQKDPLHIVLQSALKLNVLKKRPIKSQMFSLIAIASCQRDQIGRVPRERDQFKRSTRHCMTLNTEKFISHQLLQVHPPAK
uniref:Uncharacterized protein n=1 Tax=Rhizophora mucronata TaxID=61149 RepID=A0A2P2NHR3_RHIMU